MSRHKKLCEDQGTKERLILASLRLKLSFFMAHVAQCSNSTGKWQGFPKIKQNGDMSIRFLKVVLYAHNASSNFCDQSFLALFTVFDFSI